MRVPDGYFLYNKHLVRFCPEERLPFTKTDIIRTIDKRPREEILAAGLTGDRYYAVKDSRDYRFPTFEKAIRICRDISPEQNWDYPSVEELCDFFYTPGHEQLVDFNVRSQLPNHAPNVNKYFRLWEIMVYVKDQEQKNQQSQSGGGTSNATNNQQAQ